VSWCYKLDFGYRESRLEGECAAEGSHPGPEHPCPDLRGDERDERDAVADGQGCPTCALPRQRGGRCASQRSVAAGPTGVGAAGYAGDDAARIDPRHRHPSGGGVKVQHGRSAMLHRKLRVTILPLIMADLP